MPQKPPDEMLESTTEIKQGHAVAGKFVISVAVVITIICIVYLVLNFNP